MVLARELTKNSKKYLRGTRRNWPHYAERKPKGEFVVLVHRA